jgi:TPR repeat protein
MIDAVELYGLQARDDPFHEEFEHARSLLDGPDWERGLEQLEKLAAMGSMLSTICVAGCMLEGWGYDQDLAGAETWYRAAAGSGFSAGVFGLGITYLRMGRFPEAAEELKRAASQDYRPAYNALANLYSRGEGVPLDRQQALSLWRTGASKGHLQAKRGLAWGLMHGYGGLTGRIEGLGIAFQLASELARKSNAASPPEQPIRPPPTVH